MGTSQQLKLADNGDFQSKKLIRGVWPTSWFDVSYRDVIPGFHYYSGLARELLVENIVKILLTVLNEISMSLYAQYLDSVIPL